MGQAHILEMPDRMSGVVDEDVMDHEHTSVGGIDTFSNALAE